MQDVHPGGLAEDGNVLVAVVAHAGQFALESLAVVNDRVDQVVGGLALDREEALISEGGVVARVEFLRDGGDSGRAEVERVLLARVLDDGVAVEGDAVLEVHISRRRRNNMIRRFYPLRVR